AVGAPGGSAIWLVDLEGPRCNTLDFHQDEDLFVTPLANGQHINTEFGMRVTVTSAGTNAGAAIFDSTPGGPNGAGPDPDLLVDTGNLLILQSENFPPDANDVFPVPDDDDDGGTLSLAFPSPIEARSLRLVDLDVGEGTSQVILSDSG